MPTRNKAKRIRAARAQKQVESPEDFEDEVVDSSGHDLEVTESRLGALEESVSQMKAMFEEFMERSLEPRHKAKRTRFEVASASSAESSGAEEEDEEEPREKRRKTHPFEIKDTWAALLQPSTSDAKNLEILSSVELISQQMEATPKEVRNLMISLTAHSRDSSNIAQVSKDDGYAIIDKLRNIFEKGNRARSEVMRDATISAEKYFERKVATLSGEDILPGKRSEILRRFVLCDQTLTEDERNKLSRKIDNGQVGDGTILKAQLMALWKDAKINMDGRKKPREDDTPQLRKERRRGGHKPHSSDFSQNNRPQPASNKQKLPRTECRTCNQADITGPNALHWYEDCPIRKSQPSSSSSTSSKTPKHSKSGKE